MPSAFSVATQTSATSEKSEIIRTVKLIRGGGGVINRNVLIGTAGWRVIMMIYTPKFSKYLYICANYSNRDMKGTEHKQRLSDKLIGNLSSIK